MIGQAEFQSEDEEIYDSVQAALSIQEVAEHMRNDCVLFLAFYIGEGLDMEVPPIHEEIWAEFVEIVRQVNLPTWVGHIQKLFCVPRGHAKTTLTKLAVILFLRYSRINFALYVSLTSSVAKAACRDIFNWLTSDKEREVYGSPTVIKANETEQIWIMVIMTPDYGPKRIIIKALGTDQQVRGTNVDSLRPQLLVIDDAEDNDTSKTPESQSQMDVWLMGNLMKCMARRSVRIWLGNMINSRTMLYRVSKDPDWNATVYGAIVRDRVTGELVPLWPGLYSLRALLKEYKDYRSKGVGHVWVYEMMNMTADTVFKTELVSVIQIPRPSPEQVSCGIITVDPAFGLKAWNDESALAVHVKLKDEVIPHVVETRTGRWSEESLFDQLVEMSYYWNLTTWGIESTAAQQLLIPMFKMLAKMRGFPDELFTIVPLPSGQKNKGSRILAFAKSVSAGSYGIVEEEEQLLTDLQNYDPTNEDSHDDLPDAAAYGIVAWALEGTTIEESGYLKERMALLQSEEQGENVHQSQYVPY